jgi:hypothetical protein
MKTSEILQECLKYSDDPDTPWVEHWIGDVPNAPTKKVEKLWVYMHWLIDGYNNTSVITWLRDVIGIPNEELTPEACLEYRKSWVNHLIKEYQAKND